MQTPEQDRDADDPEVCLGLATTRGTREGLRCADRGAWDPDTREVGQDERQLEGTPARSPEGRRVAEPAGTVMLLAAALLCHRAVRELERRTDLLVGPKEPQARLHPVGCLGRLPHVSPEGDLLLVVQRLRRRAGQVADPRAVVVDELLEDVESVIGRQHGHGEVEAFAAGRLAEKQLVPRQVGG